jgi:hypothetical protein
MNKFWIIFLVFISNTSFADYSASFESQAYYAKEPYLSPYNSVKNTFNLVFDNSSKTICLSSFYFLKDIQICFKSDIKGKLPKEAIFKKSDGSNLITPLQAMISGCESNLYWEPNYDPAWGKTNVFGSLNGCSVTVVSIDPKADLFNAEIWTEFSEINAINFSVRSSYEEDFILLISGKSNKAKQRITLAVEEYVLDTRPTPLLKPPVK